MKILIVGFGIDRKAPLRQPRGARIPSFSGADEPKLDRLCLSLWKLSGLRVLEETDLADALAKHPDELLLQPNRTSPRNGTGRCGGWLSYLLGSDISHNLDGLEKLAALAEVKQLKIQVGFQWRYHGVLKEIRAAIAEGKIGRPTAAHAHGRVASRLDPWEDSIAKAMPPALTSAAAWCSRSATPSTTCAGCWANAGGIGHRRQALRTGIRHGRTRQLPTCASSQGPSARFTSTM